MRKVEKAKERPTLHAVKVTDEPKAEAAAAPAAKTVPAPAPDPEVVERPARRTFTAEFKRQLLAEVDAAIASGGEVGAILRRHGLYSSHLSDWRRLRDEGARAGLVPRQRGRKAQPVNPLAGQVARLERELARATARAEPRGAPKKSRRAPGRPAAAATAGAGDGAGASGSAEAAETLMRLIDESAGHDGVAPTCSALGVARATYYRRRRPRRARPPRPTSGRALSPAERTRVLATLNEERHVDLAPAAVYAKLLDEQGAYLCSVRTMYRVLAAAGAVRERRDQLTHPEYQKPELLATAPNQVWSWDITKLLGPVKWTYFYLYVVLDIFSRYVVGWMVADRENAAHARRLIAETCAKHGVLPGTLTLHQDRGAPMRAKAFAQTLADLGVTKTHSRPHISDDNPFSEAQFKTLKYRPDFPGRFAGAPDALTWCRDFFPWYNDEHRHEALGLLTPADVHFGRAPVVLAARQRVLDAAYAAHPERFVGRPPTAGEPPKEVWINKPPVERPPDQRREGPLPAMTAPQPAQGPESPEGPQRSGGGAQRLDAASGAGYPRPSDEALQ